MILACQNINKAFGTDEILNNVSFHINDREKAAIVGMNGAGKSTLLKIIMNEMPSDNGEVILAKGKTIGYLAQHQDLSTSRSIYNEILETKADVIQLETRIRTMEEEMRTKEGAELTSMLESYNKANHEFELKNGYAYRSEVVGILKGLGFLEDEFSKEISSLSGGQKTRVSLGKLLVAKPDIILLDEPTNHLDMESIAWLETFLLNYNGAVIIVAHDRYFLDKVVSKVIELDNGKSNVFSGNYTAYAEKSAMLRETELKAYFNQQREIKHQEEVITKLKSFNREKSIRRAESREKLLSKVEVLDKPMEVNDKMNIKLEPQVISGNDVLEIEGLTKAFPPLTLFHDINFDIKRGERVALIGNNGTGKTTILKIINGIIQADSGKIKLGSKVKIGYYDQEHNVLHKDKTLFEEISDEYPNLTNTQIRNVLAAFLFTNDDVYKRIKELSGGERGRVSLAKLMLSEANLLILDEPTNHLDITSKEILESALNSYTGTVLFVSHDRYFINKTATRILDLTHNSIINYIGNYDYYIDKKDELTQIYANPITDDMAVNTEDNSTKLDWKQQKEEQARQRKRENELAKAEKRIHELESRSSEIDVLIITPDVCTNVAKLVELNNEKTEIDEELIELYEKWEALAE
ncbi:MAG: ribosomal protection-like ABC-F family protein [Lachnotalea sp.]